MHRTLHTAALLTAIAIAATACAPMEIYEPPAAVNTPQRSATVVGSQTQLLGLVRTVEAWIVRVDGKHAPVYAYDKPYLVAPGTHSVVITAQEGAETATATATLTFQAGHSYVVHGGDIRGGASEVWVEDRTTGQAASQRIRAATK
jgi:hypothetical protein